VSQPLTGLRDAEVPTSSQVRRELTPWRIETYYC
jgi:hypothetical protein